MIQPSFANGFARSAGESAHPDLWKNLQAAWIPNFGNTGNQLFDLSNRQNNTGSIGGADWTAEGLLFTRSETDGISIGKTNTNLLILGDMTVQFRVKLGSTSALQVLGLHGALGDVDGSENITWDCLIDATNALRWFWEHSNGTNVDTTSSAGTGLSVGDRATLTFVRYNDGTAVKFYINGVQNGNAVTGLTRATDGSIGSIFLGKSVDAGQSFDGVMSYAYVWDRALTANEIAQLAIDPFAMFQLSFMPTFVPAAVAAGGPPKGSLSLMGVGI